MLTTPRKLPYLKAKLILQQIISHLLPDLLLVYWKYEFWCRDASIYLRKSGGVLKIICVTLCLT